MKRILSIVLVLAILVSLSACGNIDRGDENSKNDDAPTKKTLTLEKGKHEYSFGEEEEIRTFFDGYAKEHYDYTILTFDKERFIDNNANYLLWGDYSFYSERRMGAQIHTWDIVEVEKITFNLTGEYGAEGEIGYGLDLDFKYDMTEDIDNSKMSVSAFSINKKIKQRLEFDTDSVNEFVFDVKMMNEIIEISFRFYLQDYIDVSSATPFDLDMICDEIIKSVLSSIDLYNPEGEL